MENRVNKILLFGSTGMLGRYIYSYFNQETSIQVIKVDFRISNESLESIEHLLVENNINERTCVINCIGLIPQRKGDTVSDKDYFLINCLFPHLLWCACKKYNAKMIQPTTDCVFSGKKGSYLETDYHDETNAYGMSKSLGEPQGCTIVRTSIIGLELFNKKSFMEWVISNNNNTINGWTNHMWNGITCLEYCKLIKNMIENNNFWSGVRHIYSPTSKSKYELAEIIKQVFELNIKIVTVEAEEVVDKTLSSIYKDIVFQSQELHLQISNLKDFKLLN
jgi:dTDP-4-dehydrorhamnose reductase